MSTLIVMQQASGKRPKRTRHLSVWRVLLAVVLVAALTGGGYVGWHFYSATRAVASFSPWFAGYVDVTATPTYGFESPTHQSGNNVVLSFIVAKTADARADDAKAADTAVADPSTAPGTADPGTADPTIPSPGTPSPSNPPATPTDSCEPSWGTYYSLDEAAKTLDLDRRVARLIQRGGQVSVSFGGAINNELATVCTDQAKLVDAYTKVIKRYSLSTIDLDIEANNLTDESAGLRRAAAIKTVQDARAAKGAPLQVWLTLPVSPSGLTAEGVRAVTQMLEAKVNLAGVNAMTMDYGASKSTNQSMADASIQALTSMHDQLATVYRANKITLTAAQLWAKMGATPMIGQNDVRGEIFTLADAAALNVFARSQQLARMSMWSLNRDVTCGDNYVDPAVVSDGCSGIDQKGALFAEVLAQDLTGRVTPKVVSSEPSDVGATMKPAAPITDDPIKSPYVVWQSTSVYQKFTKVVWRGQVYQAKWWTTGDLPDLASVKSFDTPWTLIGPVLATDTPRVQIVLPVGTYAAWSSTAIYVAGARAMIDNVPFEAKWWSQGDNPAASLVSEASAPWRLLTGDEVTKATSTPPATPTP